MRTIVLGLGNPYAGDDGVGPAVARSLQGHWVAPEVTVREASLGGVRLLELLSGYDRAILIDAIRTPGGRPGTLQVVSGEDLEKGCFWNPSSHGVGLWNALERGRQTGLPLPRRMVILAIEVPPGVGFDNQMSPEVEAAIPQALDFILRELDPGAGDTGHA